MTIRELLIRIGFNVDRSGASQADSAMGNLERRANSLGSAIAALGAAIGMAFALKEVFQMADAWANVEARIGLVTKGIEDQRQAFDKVYELSNKTRQSFESTGDLFYKLSNASHEFGASQEDVLRVTETVNKALVSGGASTQEAKATVLQLGQALASGRLQGDELRSLDENASNLMREVAKHFGVTIGELKKLGAEGKLTSKEVFEAIKKSSAVIDAQFEQMPTTIGQATTVSMNIVGKFFRDIEKETGIFKGIAKNIVSIFSTIDIFIRNAIKSVGGFKNAIRLTGYAIAGLSLAFFIFNNKLVTATRWIAFFRLLRMGILATSRAAWAMMLNPLFWKAALIAATIALIVLVLEDFYYWITGGESVLGKYLGTWEEFKVKVLNWITELKNSFFQWITGMLTSFAEWSSGLLVSFARWVSKMITGFIGFFSNVGQMWDNMKSYAISVLSQIGNAIGRFVLSKLGWAGKALAKLAGIDLNKGISANLSMAEYGTRLNGVNITVNQELPPGTPAQQASFIQDATQQAADGMFNQKLVLGMQYGT